ncbi:hypothetical protein [Candidatus Uabimicrobium amorphum]|uniref:CARDB domain-containing protein n=1 Tax=Uabimicrobium amorphum TaxID=2596890 RepID=A0A5S9F7F6_UABAM|nr:hypothetical protein [Candidatus Uabimicrobium amorphum]BBM88143.1 hypothetical protein UABAM_06559 [Candidatus Uabimicrobium amorphum]
MNKLSIFCVLVLINSIFAQQFDVEIIPTLADPSLDYWHKSFDKDAYTIPQVKKVVPGQTFRLCIFFENYGTQNNAANVKFWVKCVKPDGSKGFTKNKLTGLSDSGTGKKQLCEKVIPISFSKNDPIGEYEIQVLCVDYINKKKLKRNFKIELTEWKRGSYPGSLQEYSQWMHNYYKNPSPNYAVHAFLTHFTPIKTVKGKKQFQYDVLHFFRTVFTKNEYLMDLALKDFASYSTSEKVKMATLCNAIGKTDKVLSLCDESERQIVSKTKIQIPDPYSEVDNFVQISMLWIEFYATGNITPIEQIVDALKNVKYFGAQKKYKDSAAQHQQEIVKDLLFQVTAWSLQQHWRISPLATSYTRYILDTNKNSQKMSIRALQQVLQSQQRKK